MREREGMSESWWVCGEHQHPVYVCMYVMNCAHNIYFIKTVCSLSKNETCWQLEKKVRRRGGDCTKQQHRMYKFSFFSSSFLFFFFYYYLNTSTEKQSSAENNNSIWLLLKLNLIFSLYRRSLLIVVSILRHYSNSTRSWPTGK
jgi:hypothetical protein